METRSRLVLARRSFLKQGFVTFAGFGLPGLWGVKPAGFFHHDLLDELTPDERKQVEASAMARDFENYFGKGYSCAESILMVALRFLKQPESRVWASAGFGGGMGRKDHCGLLTGGLMGIGFAASALEPDREAAKAWSKTPLKEFWKWWEATAPVRCADIRPPGTTSARCVRLGLLACVKLESLIRQSPSHP